MRIETSFQKYYLSGDCRRGDNCRFRHDPEAKENRRLRIEENRKRAQDMVDMEQEYKKEREKEQEKERHELCMRTLLNTSSIPLCLKAVYEKTSESSERDSEDYDPHNPSPATKIKYKDLPDSLTKGMVNRGGTVTLDNCKLHDMFPIIKNKHNYGFYVEWSLVSVQVVVDIHGV